MTRTATTIASALMISAIVGAASGCRILTTISSNCRGTEPASPTSVAPTVDLGGLVVRPGPVAIPADGLTLRRALALAGQAPHATVTTGVAASLIPADVEPYLEIRKQLQVLLLHQDFVAFGLDFNRTNEEIVKEIDELVLRGDEYINSLIDDRQQSLVQELGKSAGAKARHDELNEFLRLKPNERTKLEAALAPLGLTINQILEEEKKKADKFEGLRGQLNTFSSNTIGLPEVRLVSVSRVEAGVTYTYYLPYESAAADLGGEIRLSPGDLIHVLNYRQTPLAVQGDVPPGSVYHAQGMVAAVRELPVDRATALRKVLESNAPSTNEKDVVVMIERDRGIIRESFIIPRATANGPMSDFVMRPGDVVTMTRLPLVPIVKLGLLTGALGARGGNPATNNATPGKCLPRLHNRVHGHLHPQGSRYGIGESPPVRTATEAFDTLRARTTGIPRASQSTSP